MKRNGLLFGIAIVLLMMTSVLPGCNEEQQLVIPSSLSPQEVVEEIFPEHYFCFTLKEELVNTSYLWEGAGKEGFVEGYAAGSYNYTKADGTTIRAAPQSESGLPLLIFEVLKYENTEFAKRSYDGFGGAHELQNLTYRNITLKAWLESASEVSSVSDSSAYVIHSGCFVIFILTFGLPDVARDALNRTIDTFGVSE